MNNDDLNLKFSKKDRHKNYTGLLLQGKKLYGLIS